MALVVEDGSGVAGAESYQAIADIAAYAAKRGLVFPTAGAAEPLAEAAARRASTWLDAAYRSRLPGARLMGRAQGLEWPREGAVDAAGHDIANDEVPTEWLSAHSEASVRELARPGSLSPDVT